MDLLSEPLSTINQRLSNSTHSISPSTRSASFNAPAHPAPSSSATAKKLDSSSFTTQQNSSTTSTDFQPRYQPTVNVGRSRHNGPLAATTNQIYLPSRPEHLAQNKSPPSIVPDQSRTFIHHSDARSFQLGTAVQMKPIDDLIFTHGRRRPCHRQNALRYKSIDQDQPAPVRSNDELLKPISRYQSIERRVTPPPPPTARKSNSFDIHDELRPTDISWSVREKAKFFEHQTPTATTDQRKFSTGRENYV